MNDLGYDDLRSGLLKPAVAAFRFNVEQHPESANAWDSLADGLERAGDLPGALASCRKAVALVENEHDARAEDFRQHLSRVAATKSPGSSH